MNNPILNALNPQNLNGNSTNRNLNPFQLISEFAKFKQQMAGRDPQAIVNELLASGRMSQEQLAQLKEQASALMSILR